MNSPYNRKISHNADEVTVPIPIFGILDGSVGEIHSIDIKTL